MKPAHPSLPVDTDRHRAAAAVVARPRLSPTTRVLLLIACLFPLLLLGIAGSLRPNGAGLGTHRQLGLPPCSSRLLLGIRCPACGMTTSWSHFARGEWGASIAVNAGGFLLAVYAIGGALIGLWTSVNGRLPRQGFRTALACGAVGIAMITALDWAIRLSH